MSLTVVCAQFVAARASGPCPDKLLARVQLDALALGLGRGVEPLAQVERRDDVQQRARGVRRLFDAVRLARLDEGGPDVEVAAVVLGYKRSL